METIIAILSILLVAAGAIYHIRKLQKRFETIKAQLDSLQTRFEYVVEDYLNSKPPSRRSKEFEDFCNDIQNKLA